MAGVKSSIDLLHIVGFGWKCRNNGLKKEWAALFKEIGMEKVRSAAYAQFRHLTDFIEGRTDESNLGLVYCLFVEGRRNGSLSSSGLRRDVWEYRCWLAKEFSLPVLVPGAKFPFWIEDAPLHYSRSGRIESLERELGSARGDYFFAGLIIEDYE